MRLSQVAFSYPGKPLFRDFSLSVDPGERVALMGPSGRGKSTLLRLMAGLEKPEAGIVAGIPPEGVSMVFQENRLIPGMTLLENLTLAAPGRSRGELLGFLPPWDWRRSGTVCRGLSAEGWPGVWLSPGRRPWGAAWQF